MEYLRLVEPNTVTEEADEALLLESVKNPAVFEQIVERYRKPFLRKASRVLLDEQAAEDVVQEAFVKIYASASRFKKVPGARFSSWAYKILINTCISEYRKLYRRRTNELLIIDDDSVVPFTPEDESVRDAKAHAIILDDFLSVLSRLPYALALVLQKVVISGKHPKDIAESEGLTEGAVRTRLHRARVAFKKVYRSLAIATETGPVISI